MFFYVTNLTEQTLQSGLDPWNFQLTETLTAQIRGDKQSRQDWYQNVATRHHFYTLIEPANYNIRPSKNNPPRSLHGIAVDFDSPVTFKEALATEFPFKPSWMERSVGGNLRLIWLFETPLRVENADFCQDILRASMKWLRLGLLPGLDENALLDPNRLLCNGCKWEGTGEPAIPANALQAFYVECAKKYNFRPANGAQIPLDVVEKQIIRAFPNFVWPHAFTEGSQGPSFWIPGSVSANSAIVKAEGMFTFAAHAEKPFYTWADILGADFVKQFATEATASATKDIWFDGKSYWKKGFNGHYKSHNADGMKNYFKVNCNLSSKPDNTGTSKIDQAFNYLEHGPGRITGAAPFIFLPHGVIERRGEKTLNVSTVSVLPPADEATPWGPEGKFPWISNFYDNGFFKSKDQLVHYLAWFKRFYESGYYLRPVPGQNAFFLGGVGVGKTFNSRGIVGKAVGGFVDASNYLSKGGGFNSEMLESPLWSSDDDSFYESSTTQNAFNATLKKSAANQEHLYHKKFEVPQMVEFSGRIICTCNLDFVSAQTMDASSLDKTHLFLCASVPIADFPERHVLKEIIERELPYFLRWLLNWTPPPECIPDTRYGYKSYHHPDLLVTAHQNSKAAPFVEMLSESLVLHFRENPDSLVWEGTETQIVRLIHNNPMNAHVVRIVRFGRVTRFLEDMQKRGILGCDSRTAERNSRIWMFKRETFANDLKKTDNPNQLPPSTGKSFFEV